MVTYPDWFGGAATPGLDPLEAGYNQSLVRRISGPKKVISQAAGRLRGIPGKYWVYGAIGAAGVAIGANLFSGFDDSYNTIEGLPHAGASGSMRSFFTDFGSGYQGLPTHLMGQRIDPSLLWYRENIWNVSSARKEAELQIKASEQAHQGTLGEFAPSDFDQNISTVIGLNRRNAALRSIRLNQFAINVEDADTILLRRKGAWGWAKSALGIGDIQIRLAGIDAPEVVHAGGGDPLEDVRIWQNQPGGEAAAEFLTKLTANQDNMSLIVDPTRKTYGRYLGVLAGESGQNINLQLLKAGAVSALPFGPTEWDILNRRSAAGAEAGARESGIGLWQYARYQAIHEANQAIGRDITYNLLTRMDKMSRNLNLGAYGSYLADFGGQVGQISDYERAMARRIGKSLRKTHGPPPTGGNRFSGWDDAYNTIEGLNEKGMASRLRKKNTDFGSGFDITKQIAKQLGLSWEKMIQSRGFRKSLLEAKQVKFLGEGAAAEAFLVEGSYKGKKFRFVEKQMRETPVDKSGWTMDDIRQSFATEQKALPKLEGLDWFPSMYHAEQGSIFMEYMPGKHFAESFGRKGLATRGQSIEIMKAVNAAAERGVTNLDMHRGQFLTQGKRMSWIDFGFAQFSEGKAPFELAGQGIERAAMLGSTTMPYAGHYKGLPGMPKEYIQERAVAELNEAIRPFQKKTEIKDWEQLKGILAQPPTTQSPSYGKMKVEMAERTKATQRHIFTAANGSSKTHTRPGGRRHTDLSCTPIMR